MKKLHRRSFLTTTVLGAAGMGWAARSWAQVPSANSDIRVGVIGIGGRGQGHLSGFGKAAGCRVTGVCDVDEHFLAQEKRRFADRKMDLRTFTDLRELIESKDVDVISVATPNHWHSLASIWAVQAGKDVYVEKPVSHNVWEGRKLVEAARKYQRMVQAGTQSRSSFGIRQAVEWVQAGNLGRVLVARGLCYKPRPSIGRVHGAQPVPPGVNYDLWCGPAPMDPIRRQKFHYDWHWFWNYGNGDLGNQGIHQMDIARWFLGVNELSPRVLSVGGRLGYVDDGETANTQIVCHDYAKAQLIFEVRGLPEATGSKNMDRFPSKEKGGSVAAVIHCEGGQVVVPDYSSAIAYDRDGKEIRKWSGADDHYENFLKAVRSRNAADLNADILEGHLSSALCHTGNISHRLGRTRKPEAIRETIKANAGLTESCERMFDHLKANGVKLDQSQLSLGVALAMDPKTERFSGHDRPNEMLTRQYRKPYVVPDRV